jgi:hypothetical protein
MNDRPNPATTPTAQPAGVVVLHINEQEAAYLRNVMEDEADYWHRRHGSEHGQPSDLGAAVRCERLATYIEAERVRSIR